MFRSKLLIVALAAAIPLTACDQAAIPQAAKPAAKADAGYVAPPTVLEARLQDGAMLLSGLAPAGAKVRLASPAGAAQVSEADGEGRWSLELPMAEGARILGLSATVDGRQVQGQGYVLVTPAGQAALLRAGAGAVRLDAQRRARIGAIDFDRDGGAVVSGSAPTGAALSLKVDGRQVAESRADDHGRYAISLPSPVSRGVHQFEVSGEGFGWTSSVELTPATPLTGGPFRSQPIADGLRADWMTPGGGVQSTFILG